MSRTMRSGERELRALMMREGYRTDAAVIDAMNAKQKGIASTSTFSRVMSGETAKVSWPFVEVLAELLHVESREVFDLLTARYLGETGWPMPDETLALTAAAG